MPLIIPDHPVSPQVREEVSLIASEAINNVVKHAQATTVWLRVQIHANLVVVEIEDDGKGFSPDLPHATGEHGLANMQSRAAAICAQLEIISAPGHGTTLRLTVLCA